MKALLLALIIVPTALYYGLIAFAPKLLAYRVVTMPLSIPLALGIIWLGFIVSVIYLWHGQQQDKAACR